jgi:hypothetical protein
MSGQGSKAKVHAPGKPDIDIESFMAAEMLKTCPWVAISLENGKAAVIRIFAKGEFHVGIMQIRAIAPPENCTIEIQARLGKMLGNSHAHAGKIGYINWYLI